MCGSSNCCSLAPLGSPWGCSRSPKGKERDEGPAVPPAVPACPGPSRQVYGNVPRSPGRCSRLAVLLPKGSRAQRQPGLAGSASPAPHMCGTAGGCPQPLICASRVPGPGPALVCEQRLCGAAKPRAAPAPPAAPGSRGLRSIPERSRPAPRIPSGLRGHGACPKCRWAGTGQGRRGKHGPAVLGKLPAHRSAPGCAAARVAAPGRSLPALRSVRPGRSSAVSREGAGGLVRKVLAAAPPPQRCSGPVRLRKLCSFLRILGWLGLLLII